MPLKVIESRKEYDWSVNKPVEFRPYIKEIAGRKRMFFLGTISSIKKDNAQFDGSATPDLALIDSEYRDVVWIDAKHPSQWDKTVYNQLNEAWRASEGIGNYFQEDNTMLDALSDIEDKVVSIDSTLTNPSNKDLTVEELKAQIDSIKKARQQSEVERLQRELDSLKALEN